MGASIVRRAIYFVERWRLNFDRNPAAVFWDEEDVVDELRYYPMPVERKGKPRVREENEPLTELLHYTAENEWMKPDAPQQYDVLDYFLLHAV